MFVNRTWCEGAELAVLAVQQIRRMRGGAQSHLMLGSDQNLYVVKFQNNPQHLRVLANEMMATRLAEAVGLTVPACEVVEVTPWLVEHTDDLQMESASGKVACRAGLEFGSRLVGSLMPGQVLDYLPAEQFRDVKNLAEFAGMLCVDKWTCNVNGRQAVFYRKPRQSKYVASFIDQGFCFNAGEWTWSDAPLRGVYARNGVYAGVMGWESFEPWLGRIETFDEERIWRIAGEVPPEWYGGSIEELERLVEGLLARRERVRELVMGFRESSREPFPNWGAREKIVDGGGQENPEWAQNLTWKRVQ